MTEPVTSNGAVTRQVMAVLNAHYTITPSMFWSNIFAGAVAAALGLAALGETRRAPAR
jgi:hypothetical protein